MISQNWITSSYCRKEMIGFIVLNEDFIFRRIFLWLLQAFPCQVLKNYNSSSCSFPFKVLLVICLLCLQTPENESQSRLAQNHINRWCHVTQLETMSSLPATFEFFFFVEVHPCVVVVCEYVLKYIYTHIEVITQWRQCVSC